MQKHFAPRPHMQVLVLGKCKVAPWCLHYVATKAPGCLDLNLAGMDRAPSELRMERGLGRMWILTGREDAVDTEPGRQSRWQPTQLFHVKIKTS